MKFSNWFKSTLILGLLAALTLAFGSMLFSAELTPIFGQGPKFVYRGYPYPFMICTYVTPGQASTCRMMVWELLLSGLFWYGIVIVVVSGFFLAINFLRQRQQIETGEYELSKAKGASHD